MSLQDGDLPSSGTILARSYASGPRVPRTHIPRGFENRRVSPRIFTGLAATEGQKAAPSAGQIATRKLPLQ